MPILPTRVMSLIETFNQKIIAFFERKSKSSNKSIVLFLFLFTATISAPMLIGYQIDNDLNRSENKDVDIFRDRAQTILDGDLLYRDTEKITVTPPLINYLFIPVLLLGDSLLMWMAWFAFFLFLTSAVLFFVLDSYFDRRLAIAGSMIYSASPFGQFTSVAMLQDDSIIVFFLALSLLFLIRKRWYLAASAFGLGTMTKLFPAICAPLAAATPEKWKTRIGVIAIGLSIGLAISLPFLILAYSEFMQFLEFYLFGTQPVSTSQSFTSFSQIEQRGMSFWRYLGETIIFVPSKLLHAIFVLILVTTWYGALTKRLNVNAAFTLCILWIFIFYSKIHFGYHMMALLVLIPYALHDSRKLWSLVAVSFLARIVHLAWRDSLFTDNDWAHLLFASILWFYWIYWARFVIKNQEYRRLEDNTSIKRVLIASSWIVVLCLAYTTQIGISKVLF
ncbi:MAG: glycosyltransferase 87 family protein [Candidatus Poseidoniaceae archaeon]